MKEIVVLGKSFLLWYYCGSPQTGWKLFIYVNTLVSTYSWAITSIVEFDQQGPPMCCNWVCGIIRVESSGSISNKSCRIFYWLIINSQWSLWFQYVVFQPVLYQHQYACISASLMKLVFDGDKGRALILVVCQDDIQVGIFFCDIVLKITFVKLFIKPMLSFIFLKLATFFGINTRCLPLRVYLNW